MKRFLIVCLAAGSLLPACASAQTVSSLNAGTRVRLTAPNLDKDERIGTVVSASSDTIQFRSDARPFTRSLAMVDLTSLEVSEGRQTHRARGAGLGFAIGAVAGAITGAAAHRDCHGCFLETTRGEDATIVGIAFGGMGAVIGLIAGQLDRSEEWTNMPIRSRVTVGPSAGGARVGFSIPFGGASGYR